MMMDDHMDACEIQDYGIGGRVALHILKLISTQCNKAWTLYLVFAYPFHFGKSGFSDIFYAKSGYPDFIRIFFV